MHVASQQYNIRNLEWMLELNGLLSNFMKRPNVISGHIFRMGSNIPSSWYDAISTTGYCVKVSQVFIDEVLSKTVNFRNAELLSVTIDENKFGKCGDGSHNAWHTCVDLLNGWVMDLTIAQFGSKYNNKFLWKKVDWLKEFQAIWDDHDVWAGLTQQECESLPCWKYRMEPDINKYPKVK